MNENLDDWQKKRMDHLIVAIFSFIVGSYFFIQVKSESYIIKPSDLKIIENLITSNKPKFQETKGKRGKKWIQFKCKNNKPTFVIASFDYRCTNKDKIANEINSGDTISIKILKSDIANFKNNSSCEIHSLVKNKKEYIDIKCRNTKDNNDGKLGYMTLFAISIMAGTVYTFSKKPIFFEKVNPEIIIGIITFLLFLFLR